MHYGQWQTLNGYRWRVLRVPYNRSYDRRQPLKVEVDGTNRTAQVSNFSEGRDAASSIIDRCIVDEVAAITQQEADEWTRRLNTDWSRFPFPPEDMGGKQ